MPAVSKRRRASMERWQLQDPSRDVCGRFIMMNTRGDDDQEVDSDESREGEAVVCLEEEEGEYNNLILQQNEEDLITSALGDNKDVEKVFDSLVASCAFQLKSESWWSSNVPSGLKGKMGHRKGFGKSKATYYRHKALQDQTSKAASETQSIRKFYFANQLEASTDERINININGGLSVEELVELEGASSLSENDSSSSEEDEVIQPALVPQLVPLEHPNRVTVRRIEGRRYNRVANRNFILQRRKFSNDELQLAIDDVEILSNITRNESEMRRDVLTMWQKVCSVAISCYLRGLLEGKSKLESSQLVAWVIYKKNIKVKSYMSQCIRKWAEMYIDTRKLPEYKQGKHTKTHTIITDENVQMQLREYLRSLKDEQRTPYKFQEALCGFILADIPNSPNTVSLEASRVWMHFLGFHPEKSCKGYYSDQHNREDIIQYRNELFLPRILSLYERMEQYDGKDVEIVVVSIQPTEEDKQVVLITHDECTFYANDGQQIFWMENNKKKIKPKTNGSSLMVSGFVCPCHGFMVSEANPNLKSYKLFECGKNRDGWFNNDNLIEQLNECLPLIEELHPNCELLFAFDNSMNHHKKAPDALDALILTKKDNPAAVTKLMRDGWYVHNGQRHVQRMSNHLGQPLGLYSILQERHRWRQGMLVVCKACQTGIPHANRHAHYEGIYTPNHPIFTDQCCARYCLSQEADFKEQREWLTEVVENAGHTIIFYPKYHCELNFIERMWAFIKSRVRRECDYSYNSLLLRVPATLESVPVAFVKKSFRMCFRIMSMYAFGQGLEGPLLDYTNKKYKSHRRIPNTLDIAVLKEEFKEYARKVQVKREKHR